MGNSGSSGSKGVPKGKHVVASKLGTAAKTGVLNLSSQVGTVHLSRESARETDHGTRRIA